MINDTAFADKYYIDTAFADKYYIDTAFADVSVCFQHA